MSANLRIAHLAVGVCGELPGRQALEMAAEMARLLSAQFSALMIEDGASDILGSIPFAREYVPGRAVWREIGAAEIETRRGNAQRRAREVFTEIGRAHGLRADFEVLKGHALGDIASAIAHYDIVALVAPAQAGEWMLLPFSALADAALHARAATLVLPPRILRRRGPVAVLTGAADRSGIDLAANLAKATDEKLIVLAAGMKDIAREAGALSDQVDLPRERLRILDVDGAGVDDITHWLANIGERILVLGRGFLPQPGIDRLIRLATARGVPVLIAGETKRTSG